MGCAKAGALKSSMVVTFGPSELTMEFRPNKTHHQSLLEAVLDDILSFNVKNTVMNDLERGFVTFSSKCRSYKGNGLFHYPSLHHAPP